MMKRKIILGLILGLCGIFAMFFLKILLHNLIGTPFDFAGCFIGPLVASILFVKEEGKKRFLSATLIVFFTFVVISLGHALEQIFVRKMPVDFEPIGKFLWATIGTSWWLIPVTSLIISAIDKVTNKIK